jgi:L-fuconate dehydratase
VDLTQRLASINEYLVVALMAKKFGVKVCIHAGGVGLCNSKLNLP